MTTRIDLLCSKSARIPRGGDETGTPFAYLNYLVFNEQYVAVDGGAWRVPQTAGFNPGQEAQGYTEANNKVKFNDPITINQPGYIYVWVSNETEATKVWFDDLSVVHRKNIVSQATDYETWGGVLREQKYNEDEEYRYGYQGKFSERDLETDWHHFELREYDDVIGRWTAFDPYRAGASPFMGMGNNPINKVDPDGGCPSGDCADPIDLGTLPEGIVVTAPRYFGGGILDRVTEIWGRQNLDYSTFGKININYVRTPKMFFKVDVEITFGAQWAFEAGEVGFDVTAFNMEIFSTDPEHNNDGKTTLTNEIDTNWNGLGYKIGQEQKIRHSDYHSSPSDYKTFRGPTMYYTEYGPNGTVNQKAEFTMGVKFFIGVEVKLSPID